MAQALGEDLAQPEAELQDDSSSLGSDSELSGARPVCELTATASLGAAQQSQGKWRRDEGYGVLGLMVEAEELNSR